MQKALWQPKPSEDLAIDRLKIFAKVSDFQSLHKWSIDNKENFWRYVFEDSGVVGTLGDKGIIEHGFLDSKFFPEAQLNIVDTLLKGSADQIVITEISESGVKREYSRGQVRKIANQVAFGLQELGLKEGDVVSAIVSNVAETVFFALGALKIGAIFSSTSADFGAATVLDRFEQIKPKILLVTTSYQYNGKEIECSQKIAEIVAQLPTLKKVIAVGEKVNKFSVGQIVGVGVFVDSCRKCENCLAGVEQYCMEGMTGTYNGLERDGVTVAGAIYDVKTGTILPVDC